MGHALPANEPAIRLTAFLGVFLVMACAEALAPRRRRAYSRRLRWSNNLAVVALDTVAVRLLFPTAAVGVALLAEQRGWGLLNAIAAPAWLAVPLSVLLLDLAIYLQHLAFHAVPALWRVHRMHHADLDIDVTTGLRFHPVEIVLSMVIKLAVVTVLGAPVVAVLLFEVLLNATSMFNHANLKLPPRVDRVLRRLVVTPDMHRVHHSVVVAETNSNYGFNVPWWDRLFGTYRAAPAAGHDGMSIGIERFRTARDLMLDRMLLQPLRSNTARVRGPDWIEVEDLRRLASDGASVIDVRSPAEFTGPLGHIPGAINIPLETVRQRIADVAADKEQRLVLVCKTDKRSVKAAEWLSEAGYGRVAVLRGGMERWSRQRAPHPR
jgi:sterol desaturase/sphingolipid hydroxylase (fatty acid hydroxylase superfamily)/rhodanese-related sulfurtransferase